MADKPIHTPVVVLDPDGEVSVHDGVSGAEAALHAAGSEATHHSAYDALGDRLTIEIEEVIVEAEGPAGRPTRRALLFGRVASALRTRRVVIVRKEATSPPAEPWVRNAIESALVDEGLDEERFEEMSFGAVVRLAAERLGEPGVGEAP